MAGEISNGIPNAQPPAISHDAVFKASEVVPEGVPIVSGIEFNDFKDNDVTAADLVSKMANMGFQAGAVAEAARIINDMVF